MNLTSFKIAAVLSLSLVGAALPCASSYAVPLDLVDGARAPRVRSVARPAPRQPKEVAPAARLKAAPQKVARVAEPATPAVSRTKLIDAFLKLKKAPKSEVMVDRLARKVIAQNRKAKSGLAAAKGAGFYLWRDAAIQAFKALPGMQRRDVAAYLVKMHPNALASAKIASAAARPPKAGPAQRPAPSKPSKPVQPARPSKPAQPARPAARQPVRVVPAAPIRPVQPLQPARAKPAVPQAPSDRLVRATVVAVAETGVLSKKSGGASFAILQELKKDLVRQARKAPTPELLKWLDPKTKISEWTILEGMNLLDFSRRRADGKKLAEAWQATGARFYEVLTPQNKKLVDAVLASLKGAAQSRTTSTLSRRHLIRAQDLEPLVQAYGAKDLDKHANGRAKIQGHVEKQSAERRRATRLAAKEAVVQSIHAFAKTDPSKYRRLTRTFAAEVIARFPEAKDWFKCQIKGRLESSLMQKGFVTQYFPSGVRQKDVDYYMDVQKWLNNRDIVKGINLLDLTMGDQGETFGEALLTDAAHLYGAHLPAADKKAVKKVIDAKVAQYKSRKKK